MYSLMVVGTFKGLAAVGYEAGKEYTITIDGRDIHRVDGTGLRSYDNIEGFMLEWTNVKVL